MDPETLQKIVQRSVNIHKNWGPQMNSPGAFVDVKEVYRRPGAGQTMVAYHVYVRGLPGTKNYALLQADNRYRQTYDQYARRDVC